MKYKKCTMFILMCNILTLVSVFPSASAAQRFTSSQKSSRELGVKRVVKIIHSIEEMPGYEDAVRVVENLSTRFVNLKFLMFQRGKLQKPWIFVNQKLTDKNCVNNTQFNIGIHILMCQGDEEILIDNILFEKVKNKYPRNIAIALTHEIFRNFLISKLTRLQGDSSQEIQQIKKEAEEDLLFFNHAMYNNLMPNLDDRYIKNQFFNFSGLELLTKNDFERMLIVLSSSFKRLCSPAPDNEPEFQVFEPGVVGMSWMEWSNRYTSAFSAFDRIFQGSDGILGASLDLLGLKEHSNFFESLGLQDILVDVAGHEDRAEMARKVNEKLTSFTLNNFGFRCHLHTVSLFGPTRTPQGGRTDGGVNVTKRGEVLESALYKRVRVVSSVEMIPGFDRALLAINKASVRFQNLRYLMLEKESLRKPWIFVHHEFKVADCEKHAAFRFGNRILMCQGSREIVVDSDLYEEILIENPKFLAQAITLEILRSFLLSKLFWTKGLPAEELAQSRDQAEKSLLFFNFILHNDQIREQISDQLIVNEFFNFTNTILSVNGP